MFYYKETCRVERGFHLVTPSFFPECIILYYLLSCPHSRCLESTTFHSHLIQQSCMKHAGCPGGNRWAKVPGRKCPDKSTNRCKLEYEWYRQGAMRGRRRLGTSGCRVHTQGGREAGLWRTSRTLTSRYGGHTCLTERAAKARERDRKVVGVCHVSQNSE